MKNWSDLARQAGIETPEPGLHPVPSIPAPPNLAETIAQRARDHFQADLEERAAEEKLRILARRMAQREIDEESLAETTGSDAVVRRAKPLGTAALRQPDSPPAAWGEGNRVAWAEGQTMMIAAPQGLGKSTFAQQLMLRRIGAIQGDFLGMPVKAVEEGTCLYLGMDRPPQILASIKRMIRPDQEDYVNERAVFWEGGLPLGLVANPSAMVEWVFEQSPNCHTIIFDSVKDIMPGISKDEVGGMINTMWQELLVNGIQVLALHHHRKNGQGLSKVHSLDEIYGSTWLTSGAGTVFSIDGVPGEARVTFKQLKSAAEMLEELDAMHDFPTGGISLNDGPILTVSGVLGEAGSAGATVEDIAMAVHLQVTTATKQRVNKELKKLKEAGFADQLPRQGRNVPARWVKTDGPSGGSNKYIAALANL